jgi:thiosulfate/3-mercaptopyruvate sulfurtransferase
MLPLILEAEELAEHIADPGILIVDLCKAETYIRMHIPGAVHVEPAELISGIQPAVGKLPPLNRLEALFNRIGYTPEKHIIAYDDEGGGWAGRFIWTLDVIGHQQASFLNGGLIAWADAGLSVTTEMPEVAETSNNLSILDQHIATKEQVLASLDDPQSVVWDARSAEEYAGTRVVASRGGHIPGAINFDWLLVMDPDRQLRLRVDLADRLQNTGITTDKSVITHCQTHHRSGLTYLAGKSLGYSIRAYDGSWSEWGNDPDTPIES